MKKFFVAVAVLAAAILLSSTPAKADTIYFSDCGGNCPLATYTVTVVDNGNGTFNVSLKIDIDSNATIVAGATDHIQSVSVKFSNDLTASSLLSAPTLPGSDTWNTVEGNANDSSATGCTTNASSGKACSYASGAGLPISLGGSYTWTWQLTPSGGLVDPISVQANFDPANGRIVSCPSTDYNCTPPSVPEPGTLTLFGMGLLGLAGLKRRVS